MPVRVFSLLLLAFLSAGSLSAQVHKGTFALKGARIETITHGTIDRGTLIIRDGRIAALGADVAIPGDAEVIDCSGLTLYPGMIDAGTQLGLVEIGSQPEARDDDELGEITPQMQALTAVNPNSVEIPVTRVNGVTTVLTFPGGGLFPGTAAVINLLGYTPAQMQVGSFKGVVMNFPSSGRDGEYDDRSDEDIEKSVAKGKKRLKDVWESALLYTRIDSAYSADGSTKPPPEYLPELIALAPVVRGAVPLLIEVNAARDIDSALAWVKEHRVKAIFTGVSEGWRVADKIAAAGIPCIVGPVLTIPGRTSDRYDKAYANPGLLQAAGVRVALRTAEAANVRNLPYQAGFAVAYGMAKEEGLRAVTINPARIFGIDSLLGSLEVGKQATLFAADGDPFEPATHVQKLFIDGYMVPLESRHVELYKEFLKRVPGVTK
ncbi:MAG: amidohydrolase family protein [Candidatus Kapaibacterium sp.]